MTSSEPGRPPRDPHTSEAVAARRDADARAPRHIASELAHDGAEPESGRYTAAVGRSAATVGRSFAGQRPPFSQ
jgi:hypothetical protein